MQREFYDTHTRYMVRFFWRFDKVRPGQNQVGPCPSEEAFERRLSMARDGFVRVVGACIGCDDSSRGIFRRGLCLNAVEKKGISLLVKVIAGNQKFSYVIPDDFFDDALKNIKTTASFCLTSLCRQVVNRVLCEHLHEPSYVDLVRIEGKFRDGGLPGCIAALDCAKWRWKTYQKAL